MIDYIGNLEIVSGESFENSHQWIKRLYKNLVQKGSNNDLECPLFQLFNFSLLPLFIESRRSLNFIKMNNNQYYYPKSSDFMKNDYSKFIRISEIFYEKKDIYLERFQSFYDNFKKRKPGTKTIEKRSKNEENKNILYRDIITKI